MTKSEPNVETEAMEAADTKEAATDLKEPSANDAKQEQRDDSVKDENGNKGSSNTREIAPKKTTKPKKSSNNNSSNIGRNGSRYPPDRYPYPPGRGPYPGHGGPGMHPGGPRGPPPPYGYGGPPPDHFRGPPPPHYRQMPPMMHQGGPAHYGGHGPNGPYGPPPPSMGGPHYNNPYGHYMGGPPMPYPHPNFQGVPPNMPSDNSMSSNKSKSSNADKSNKSQGSKSAARKKRTIDGINDNMHHHHDLPSAYAFRRNTSNASSSTTVTTGNNTSTETDESKRHELPPLSQSSHANFDGHRRSHHRRDNSGASTTSSLSVGGFSLSSYEGHRSHGEGMSIEDNMMLKQSPKRRKGHDSTVLVVDTGNHENRALRRVPSASSQSLDAAESNRFQKLTMEDNKPTINPTNSEDNGASLFLSLSTSPINNDVDATPISKNTKKEEAAEADSQQHRQQVAFPMHPLSKRKETTPKSQVDRTSNTPTPPLPSNMAESAMMTDEHMLNNHLRNQSFTPLPHMGAAGENSNAADSPSNLGGFGAIAPQLSWSIAGDTPSLGDLAEWEEHAQHAKGDEKIRPSSTTSANSRSLAISPHSFSMWAEEEHSRGQKNGDDMRLSILTPHSDLGMAEGALSGTTTPLPMFFEQPSSDERENRGEHRSLKKSGDTEHIHSMFVSSGGRGSSEKRSSMHHFWKKDGLPTPVNSGQDRSSERYGHQMGFPPTPMYAASDYGRDDGFMRSPQHGHRDDFFPSSAMYGHPASAGHDRVRNLRGRAPPGHHMAPMPLHIPPHNMSSHLPMTSPMGVGHGKAGLWSPHHGGMPPLGSPLHMSPMNMSQSKRKCVPLKPPIPSKFQGDIEKFKGAAVPEFTTLVNFPAHMSQKQSVNLPDGMRCCVMCGQACPCSSGNKNKKCGGGAKGKNDGSLAPRNSNGQDMLGDKNGYAIIPTQNKGLCTLCDVNVWVVCNTGLEIKWCKGCKNFRPWAAFGDKGLATKCLRCRERQREKYALQKEEKEKARLLTKAGKK